MNSQKKGICFAMPTKNYIFSTSANTEKKSVFSQQSNSTCEMRGKKTYTDQYHPTNHAGLPHSTGKTNSDKYIHTNGAITTENVTSNAAEHSTKLDKNTYDNILEQLMFGYNAYDHINQKSADNSKYGQSEKKESEYIDYQSQCVSTNQSNQSDVTEIKKVINQTHSNVFPAQNKDNSIASIDSNPKQIYMTASYSSRIKNFITPSNINSSLSVGAPNIKSNGVKAPFESAIMKERHMKNSVHPNKNFLKKNGNRLPINLEQQLKISNLQMMQQYRNISVKSK